MTKTNYLNKKIKIAYLPLDERPCNYKYPELALKGSKRAELITIERSALGLGKVSGDYGKIKNFVLSSAKIADALVISLETLLYGGLFPSRLHNLSGDEILNRLNLVTQVKEINPAIKIYAFTLIMRCPTYTSSAEEPDYYGVSGREIFLSGVNRHKYSTGEIGEDEYIKTEKELIGKIGEENLKDYVLRREKNLSAIFEALKLNGKVFDELVIPLDDSNPYGYTAMDKKRVADFIEKNGLKPVMSYPGADEVGLTLISRCLTEAFGIQPKIHPVYSSSEAKNVVPLYEDRAVSETVAAQIKACGAVYEENADKADLILLLNVPEFKQREARFPSYREYRKRDLTQLYTAMRTLFKKRKSIIVADNGYANGGEAEYVKKAFRLCSPISYAGWNTDSNTLGTAIAAAIYKKYFGGDVSGEFFANRVVEDICYQTYARWKTKEILPRLNVSYDDIALSEANVRKYALKKVRAFFKKHFKKLDKRFSVVDIAFPLSRLFECDVTVKRIK